MLTTYLKIAKRNFLKQRTTFVINLTGLTMGLTTVILIMMWVVDELSYNKQHENGDRLVQVMTNHDNSGGIVTIHVGPGELAESLGTDFSQVVQAVGTSPFIEDVALEIESTKIAGSGYFVDQAYFELFNLEFLAGNRDMAMADLDAIVISESTAEKLFGSVSAAFGKTLDWQVYDFQNTVKVTGIYKDLPHQTTQYADFFLSFPYFKNMLGEGLHWDNHNAQTFLLLAENTDLPLFNDQIQHYIQSKLPDSNVTVFAQPFIDRYLYGTYEEGKVTGGRITYVRLFSAIAIFILVMACINFMNLTTAKSMSRAKEIGVKKSMGASRFSLFTQFISESLLITFIALALAVITVFLVEPYFNQISGKNLNFDFQMEFLVAGIIVWLVTGFVAGFYPALYLSKFKPIQVLQSNLKGGIGELIARKGLVIFQFSISLLLIIGILVIDKQMSYMQSQNLGYDQSHLIQINPAGLASDQLDSYLEEIRSLQGVEKASSISHSLIGLSSSTIGLKWEGKDEEDIIKFENITANMDLVETMGFGIVAGRSFQREFGDEKSKLLINESAVRVMGFENPVGKMVNLWGNDMEIIGVVKDFHFESLKENVKPAFIKYSSTPAVKLIARLNSANQSETIQALSKIHEARVSQPMEFKFMDEDYQSLYAAEKRVEKLAKYFGFLAIGLSCLGLFGLATFTTEKRRKEIGIRKVLGASLIGIISLVSKDFIVLVLVAILISMPIGYYFSNSWLVDYAYQTDLNWWIFAGSAGSLLLIAILTVGFQAFKSASSNPINSLSSE